MNGQIKEKYLPVGTVVLLANGTKRVMINGFCTMDANNPDRIFDYSGVLFPEGSLSSDQTLLFDHNQIVRVDHMGLEDEEEKSFKVKLKEIVAASTQGNQGSQGGATPVAGAPTPAPAPAPVQAAPATPAAPVPPTPPVPPAAPSAPQNPQNPFQS